jgi:spermidine synthase
VSSLFGELLKLFRWGEEVRCSCVDVDAHVVAVSRRFPKTFEGMAKKAEACEEAVDALTERQSERTSGGEEE